MSKVEVYTAILLAVIGVLGVTYHGEPKKGKYSLGETIVHLLIFLPIYGRIFGWW